MSEKVGVARGGVKGRTSVSTCVCAGGHDVLLSSAETVSGIVFEWPQKEDRPPAEAPQQLAGDILPAPAIKETYRVSAGEEQSAPASTEHRKQWQENGAPLVALLQQRELQSGTYVTQSRAGACTGTVHVCMSTVYTHPIV